MTRRRRSLAVLAGLATLLLTAATALASAHWLRGPSMGVSRAFETATLLPNGNVLIAGGIGSLGPGKAGFQTSASLFEPSSDSFVRAASMSTARFAHSATLLQNGMVLVAGGVNLRGPTASAELYDYKTNTWLPAANMPAPRVNQTATLLPDGNVLVAGGVGAGGAVLRSAVLYDPATNSWSSAGKMHFARFHQTATLLPNGTVLIAGGERAASNGSPILYRTAELYNPSTNSWSLTGSMAVPRSNHVAALLGNGQVLVAGGGELGIFTRSAEIYNPHTGHWRATGSMCCRRAFATATTLLDGRVLVAGGYAGQRTLNSAEVYDPTSGRWMRVGRMHVARGHQAASVLLNGQVLEVGGQQLNGPFLASSDLYVP